MRLARVMGKVVLNRRLPEFPVGTLLLCEALDTEGLKRPDEYVPRAEPMGEALVVLDEQGAGEGCLVAVSEGREASMPWWPEHKPVDAYCVAIIDSVDLDERYMTEASG